MPRETLANSTYLDLTSYGTTTATTVEAAYQLGHAPPTPSTTTLNVALILPRANDPTALLQSDWGTRQTTLGELNANGTLWSTFGATASDYNGTLAELQALGIPVLGDANGADGYITSQESRTIWVQLTPAHFQDLFGTILYGAGPYLQYWHGELSLPDTIKAAGVWFDSQPIWGTYPAPSDLSQGHRADLQQGPQSIGNSLATTKPSLVFSGDMAQWFYNFPLTGSDVATATVGLVEPGIGDALPAGAHYTFQEGLNGFRHQAGLAGPGSYYGVANNGLDYYLGNNEERSLDIGVVASASPGSTIGLYGGSGFGHHANSNAFTAYQAAFWDQTHNPPVVSSSFGIFQQSAPGSPFASAVRELFVDAALRNITTFVANNDWGSSYNFSTGIAHQNINLSSPYALLVGGTSITAFAAALHDPSVYSTPSLGDSVYGLAIAGDLSMLWLLVEGGLTKLPSSVSGAEGAETALLESVWNVYALHGTHLNPGLDLSAGGASDGGVDTTQPTPWYQTAFGLTPTSVNPAGGTGRGAPDVAANAGGNMFYNGPPPTMAPGSQADLWDYWGTSASTPLWASLTAQIDTIFHDQGLPNLGYMNDLLYTAAAIAPASFNDITFGNNVSSYLPHGTIDSGGSMITLTGFGYSAAPGYDLTTGLGTPNGTLLARALSAIAHEQLYYDQASHMVDADGNGGWESGADQSLLFQTTASSVVKVELDLGPDAFGFFSTASASFAWTSQFAQQSLQADFDPALVRLYDKQAQGSLGHGYVSFGADVSVSIDSAATHATQATLTGAFGFADFMSDDGAVRVARPVAVAETAGGSDDQIAVVRLRQNGQDSLSLSFYRVDDLTGAIGNLHPGDHGYAEAAQARAIQTTTGGASIAGPGYGNYGQTGLADIDAGELIAMQLTNNTSGNTYWAFASANEAVNSQHVGHLWNYGLNTWGWEDLYGGGDRDYNDLVVQLDFTSASGHGWLA